jgi:anti-sigma regulatory factor (Ser/Thr protein kinase)
MSGEHITMERLHGSIEPSGEAAAGAAAILTDLPLGQLDLPAAPESVPRARRFVRSITAAYEIPHVESDAEVLASELVTNAVRHAMTPERTLRLVVYRAGDMLRIEVHDPCPVIPITREIDLLDETGRGWFLVAVIADRHGTDHTATGKSVWCEVRAWSPLDGSGWLTSQAAY